MEYLEVKEILADPQTLSAKSFSVLNEIARRVNNRALRDEGRDLVIRSLAVLKSFSPDDQAILLSLVRSVGLFPYMTDLLDMSDIEDRIAYELHRADNLDGGVIFHSLQAQIFHQLIAGSNVVLSASTSVGKSLVIDALIASGKYAKIAIIVPTIALIDEIRKRLVQRFGQRCAIITHRSQLSHDGRLNIFVLTQERALMRDDLDGVDLVIVDEFYKMNLGSEGSPERAIDLNLAFHRLAKSGAQFYLLGPNVHAISGLELYEHHFIPSRFSTVAVDVVSFDLPTHGDDRSQKLLSLCKEIDDPTIIYCQSPKSASKVALDLAMQGGFEDVADVDAAAEWIGEVYHPDWIVCQALRKGIGLHHGGVPRALQQLFIRLFNDRKIRFLVCTSTIIEGVNTVARNVIIYDRRKSKSVLDHFTYKNIEGRAGRMRQYFVGRVFVLESPPAEQQYSVECPIGVQNDDTPLDLLLSLEDDDLTSRSRERLNAAFRKSTLSEETLRLNRHLSLESQEAIAAELRADPMRFHLLLSWNSIPTGDQLRAVCNLIFNHLEGKVLPEYWIFSGDQLNWHLNELRVGAQRNLTTYLSKRIHDRGPDETVSDVVENSMRFLRNIVCQRFPQDLMAIDRIQKEVLAEWGFGKGDFGLFAEQAENCFMSPLLYALDEYGLPVQIAQKLSSMLLPAEDLDTVLARLRRLSPIKGQLSAFEQELLGEVQRSINTPSSS